MDFRQLPYFLGVYEAKSITKASERLNVAQPALGLQVRKLEEELGVDLFSAIPEASRRRRRGNCWPSTPGCSCGNSNGCART